MAAIAEAGGDQEDRKDQEKQEKQEKQGGQPCVVVLGDVLTRPSPPQAAGIEPKR